MKLGGNISNSGSASVRETENVPGIRVVCHLSEVLSPF